MRESGAKGIFEIIVAENFSELVTDPKSYSRKLGE